MISAEHQAHISASESNIIQHMDEALEVSNNQLAEHINKTIEQALSQLILSIDDRLSNAQEKAWDGDSPPAYDERKDGLECKSQTTVSYREVPPPLYIDTGIAKSHTKILGALESGLETTVSEISSHVDNRFRTFEQSFVDGISQIVRTNTEQMSIAMTRIEDGFRSQDEKFSGLEGQLKSLSPRLVTTETSSIKSSDGWSATVSQVSVRNQYSPKLDPACNKACGCRCHHVNLYTNWKGTNLRHLLGSFVLSYSGFSGTQKECNEPACRNRVISRQFRLHYRFPTWLTYMAVSLLYSQPKSGGPEFLLRVSRRIPPGSADVSQSIVGYIRRRDVEGVRQYLEKHPYSVCDELAGGGTTPLHNAMVTDGSVPIIKLLLQAGSDPFYRCTDGSYAVSMAFNLFIRGHPIGLEMSKLPEMPFGEYIESDGFSDLERVIVGSLVLDLRECLRKRQYFSTVNKRTVSGRTALELAASKGDLEAVELLLDAGADPNLHASNGRTPLHRAALRGDYDICKCLLEAGANVNAVDTDRYTPLHSIGDHGGSSRDLTSLLLQYGADIHAKDAWNEQPLGCTLTDFSLDRAEVLIAHGADVNNRDWEGDTVLLSAIGYRHDRFLKLVLANGADYTVVNDNGRGVMHRLAHEGTAEMMGIFTRARMTGVSIDHCDKMGKTPTELLDARYDVSDDLRRSFEELVASIGSGGENEDVVEVVDDDDDDDEEESELEWTEHTEDSDDEFFDATDKI
jgi:ankyrin repeat protein